MGVFILPQWFHMEPLSLVFVGSDIRSKEWPPKGGSFWPADAYPVEMRPKTALIQLMNKIATTWQVFKADTGYDGKADKRGSQIRRIDDVFQQYSLNFGGGTQKEQIGLTMAIYTECKDWLKKKQQKSDNKTGFLKVPTLNQNLVDRRAAIGTVAKECLTELRGVAAISKQAMTFNTRKIDMLARGMSAPRPVALSGGYRQEKESWDRSGKTAALAGTTVHGLAGRGGTPFDDLSQRSISVWLRKRAEQIKFSISRGATAWL